MRAGMYAHRAEVVAEARLHVCARRRVQRHTGRGENLADGRWRRCDFVTASVLIAASYGVPPDRRKLSAYHVPCGDRVSRLLRFALELVAWRIDPERGSLKPLRTAFVTLAVQR